MVLSLSGIKRESYSMVGILFVSLARAKKEADLMHTLNLGANLVDKGCPMKL